MPGANPVSMPKPDPIEGLASGTPERKVHARFAFVAMTAASDRLRAPILRNTFRR